MIFVAAWPSRKRVRFTGEGRGLVIVKGISGGVVFDLDCIIIIRPLYLYVVL